MTDPDLSRLAIHTQTNRPWDLRTCCDRYAAAGIGAIGVWRHLINPDQGGVHPLEARRILDGHALRAASLVRGGFFVSPDPGARAGAINESLRAIDEAQAIGADHVVLVVGASPDVALDDAREMVVDGIGRLVAHSESAGVRLAIEPLHPIYAADRSCVNTLRTANDLCDRIAHPAVGVAIDAYHVWWEPDLRAQIVRAGSAGRILGFHICDWKPAARDPLNDRGLMGDGCIDLASISRAVDQAGFGGPREVEVFSDAYWSMDQDEYLELIIERYAGARLD